MSKQDYLSKENTTSVNGIFIIVVFLSHMRYYIQLPQVMDSFLSWIGQLMVAMFLFYSGFGVMESIQSKGMTYVKSIPSKRVGKVLLFFDIAVILYALLNVVLNIPFSFSKFVLALLGWENLENSNWYIFVILCLYLVTWLAFLIGKERKWLSFWLLVLFTIALFVFLHETKERWWYNTLTAYLFGAFFSLEKEKWKSILDKPIAWFIITIFSVGATVILKPYSWHSSLYLVMTITYCMFVICVTQKVPIYNRILYWIGSHLFGIYILMRIPMLILERIPVNILHNPLIFGVISLVLTLLMATVFHWLLQKKIIVRKE